MSPLISLFHQQTILENWHLWTFLIIGILTSIRIWKRQRSTKDENEPPSIPEWIPGLNAYMHTFHNLSFLQHIQKKYPTQPILKLNLGFKTLYIIKSPSLATSLLRAPRSQLSTETFTLLTIERLGGASPRDLQKFINDRTTHRPFSNLDSHVPETKRCWAPTHKLFHEYLFNPSYVQSMQRVFQDEFLARLDVRLGSEEEWQTVDLYAFLRKEMAEAAVASIAGREILRDNVGFVDAMWGFDESMWVLGTGFPRWMVPGAYRKREVYFGMGEKWLTGVLEEGNRGRDMGRGKEGDREGDSEWDERWGSRYIREHAKFFLDRNFDMRSQIGLLMGAVWAANGNSIPLTTWLLFHVLTSPSPSLLHRVREACQTALTTSSSNPPSLSTSPSDPTSNPPTSTTPQKTHLNPTILTENPLLQSLYTETLRLHVSTNNTRKIVQDLSIAGYVLKKGGYVQMPAYIAGCDAGVWDEDGHPAGEFWGERFLKFGDEDGEKVQQFSMEGRASGFFPYGGGLTICPGRNLAKSQMLTVLALFVLNFDIEVVGSESLKELRNDSRRRGAAGLPPDGEVSVRVRRRRREMGV